MISCGISLSLDTDATADSEHGLTMEGGVKKQSEEDVKDIVLKLPLLESP